MASASMNMQGLDNLRRWESVGQLMDSAATVLEGELQQGKDEMQSMIESRGTGRTWSEYWQRRTGRTGSAQETAAIPSGIPLFSRAGSVPASTSPLVSKSSTS